MTRITRFLLALLAVGLAALIPLTGTRAQPSVGHAGGQAGLVGTWLLTIPDEPPGLITFHADGTLVGTMTPVHPPIGPEPPHVTAVFHSALQGVWAQDTDRQYRMTLVVLEYDQNGELVFIINIHSQITLAADANSFTTRDSVEVRSPDGTLIFAEQDQTGVRGTRIRLGSTTGAGTQAAGTTLQNVAGAMVGQASFTQMGDHVLVEASVRGLPPGFHGFHVRAVGTCDPATAFMSAGGHLNPEGRDHDQHAGDQPVLYVLADGSGRLSFLTDRYHLADLFDADGSALIVHALADNFANIPTRYAPNGPDEMTRATGYAGGRLACGVIQAAR